MTQAQETQKRWAGSQAVGINKYKVNARFIDPDHLLLEWNPPNFFQRFEEKSCGHQVILSVHWEFWWVSPGSSPSMEAGEVAGEDGDVASVD